MSVHMFRCCIGRGSMSVSDLEQRVDDWIASNGERVEDTADHVLAVRNSRVDGSGVDYHAIDVRFVPDQSKDNLLQKFEDKLKEKVAWYRVGYHTCTHRDGDGSDGACGWDDSTEWTAKDVTILSGVPTFP